MLIIGFKKLFFYIVFLFLATTTNASEKMTLAVMDLTTQEGASISEAVGISDLLRTEFINSGRFNIVERKQIDTILAEQKLQNTGCTTDECTVELGRLLNVNAIVIGSLTKIGNKYHIAIRLVNVEKGTTTAAHSKEVFNLEDISYSIKPLIAEFIYKIPVTGKVIDATKPKEILIDLGLSNGVVEGNILRVIRIGEAKKDEKGKIIFQKKDKIGRIKLTAVQEEASLGEVIESNLTIDKGDIVELDIKEGTLEIITEPSDALVYLNGKAIGNTPLTTKILVGKYKLIIDKAEYSKYEESIEINEGKTLTKEVELKVQLQAQPKTQILQTTYCFLSEVQLGRQGLCQEIP